MTLSLSIIVPIIDEADNIPLLLERLRHTLRQLPRWEVIFVDDDSRDQSRQVLLTAAQQDARVRLVTRIGRAGLASAVIEGALSSSADCIAVMDGDLQHDAELLPQMLAQLEDEPVDLVVGSRFLTSAAVDGLSATRERLSRVGNWLSQTIIKTRLSDPLSGFFMLRRSVFEEVVRELSGAGFKILLDILATSKRQLRVRELPFRFGTRQHGASKIDSLVTLEFGLLLADKWFGRWVPVRFLLFTAVGGLGVGIHIALLAVMFKALEWDFYAAQIGATTLTMAVNFTLNNLFTYRSQRLRGRRFVYGLLSFYLVCAVGALANFQLAEFLFNQQWHWALAGFVGAAVGAVWNYAVTSRFTWRRSR